MRLGRRQNVVQQVLSITQPPKQTKKISTSLFKLPGYCFTSLPASFIQTSIQQIPQPAIHQLKIQRQFRSVTQCTVISPLRTDLDATYHTFFLTSPARNFAPVISTSKLLQGCAFPSEPRHPRWEVPDWNEAFRRFRQAETPRDARRRITGAFHELKCQMRVALEDPEFAYLRSFTVQPARTHSILQERTDLCAREVERVIALRVRLVANFHNLQVYGRLGGKGK
ncbi:hypothetical protein SS50377_24374 [Spironucleus salmonicida]|uniref:Uncharacterized protein n=2 Tax=Spironucleus salmonicida TaxID=348837 RepID=A0A9P8LUA8_9EUKA|nr:hypothetical protein SS50377_24374 [Spironucleus salmonicida]